MQVEKSRSFAVTAKLKHSQNIMNIIRLLLGFFLPPLGVFLTVGVGPTFFINILLTLLGWLPGSVHAIWVIAKHNENQNREEGIY